LTLMRKAHPEMVTQVYSQRALVMKYIEQLVVDGFAQWKMLDEGDIQLRFATGETFLLKESVIVRLE
jgi:hypothetical protein